MENDTTNKRGIAFETIRYGKKKAKKSVFITAKPSVIETDYIIYRTSLSNQTRTNRTSLNSNNGRPYHMQ